MHRLLAAGAALVWAARIASAAPDGPDGSVSLPAQNPALPHATASRQAELSRSAPWREFIAQHGSWSVLWNEATGTPRRAFGEAIPVDGYTQASRANVWDAARSFLERHRAALGVDPAALRPLRATLSRGTWYVSYVQVHQGIDVLFSEVELRISTSARVMAFGSIVYPGIRVPTDASLPAAAAAPAAASGLPGAPAVDPTGNRYILPIVAGEGTVFRLVHELSVRTRTPPGNFVALVDAHSAELLWRHNRVRYTEVTGRVEGTVQLVLPTDPFVLRPFSSQHVDLGGTILTTDSTGLFRADITSSVPLTARLEGSWVDVNRQDGPDAIQTFSVTPGDSVNLVWGDSQSHPAERDAFFHTTRIHDFITRLDTQFTAISYSMPCAVNIDQTCNAFWDGIGINFFRAGGRCPNTAQMADVVYHEYGHGINDRLYQQLGVPWGMMNGAVHEGMADVASAAVLDDPRIGRGFFGPGTVLRLIQNTNSYPADISSDPHITGLILAGAFWDLRTATSVQTMRELSHFAKYGLPDDLNDGAAFSEWFVETLVADDDDGNLGNGTPHSTAIINAFDAHGIGSALFFQLSFTHVPLPSTDDTVNAYTVAFTLAGAPIPGAHPDSAAVCYSTDDFVTTQVIPAAETTAGFFEAAIPAQSGGTLVEYFIRARDPLRGSTVTFPDGAPSVVYRFLVGRQSVQPGVLYAAEAGTPSGLLHTVDPVTLVPSTVGPIGIPSLQGLAVNPATAELYGVSATATGTTLYRLSPVSGDAVMEHRLAVPNLRAIAFASGDTLYAGSITGGLYRVSRSSGQTDSIGHAPGVVYSGLAFHPGTRALWASVRPAISLRDRIYRIDIATGEATLVGATGDNQATPSLAFSPDGTLYGLKGTSAIQPNTIIRIDTATGNGTVVGSPGISGLTAITMSAESVATSVSDAGPGLPRTMALDQNFPNPFNPRTTIGFRIAGSGRVELAVFDLLGRRVLTLVDEQRAPGAYSIGVDASQLGSGVYIYRLTAQGVQLARKMMLVK